MNKKEMFDVKIKVKVLWLTRKGSVLNPPGILSILPEKIHLFFVEASLDKRKTNK